MAFGDPYLIVTAGGGWFRNHRHLDGDYYACYRMPDELVLLIDQWAELPPEDDHTLSGVIADCFSDHRSDLLAQEPDKPADDLDAVIDFFRNRLLVDYVKPEQTKRRRN